MWDNTCSYSATANGDYAYCQTSSSGAAGWRRPDQMNPGFVCGRRAEGSEFDSAASRMFTQELSGRRVSGGVFQFIRAKAGS